MAEQIARFKPGVNLPAFAKTAVIAGRFVKIVDTKTASGAYQIGHATAGSRVFGVAEASSAAATEPATSVERMVNVVRNGAIARVLAGDDIGFGDAVASDANGKAVPATEGDEVAGYAVCDADDATFAEIDLGGVGPAGPTGPEGPAGP